MNSEKKKILNIKRQIKYTLPTIFLTITTIIIFFIKTEKISLNFTEISKYQFWRVLTAQFYSKNYYFLFSNIFLLFFLSLLREPKKSSLPYIFDFLIKNILIFSFSILLFLILLWSGKIFEGFFLTISENQISELFGGIHFFAISEILVVLNFLRKTKNLNNEKFFFQNFFFLFFIFCLISIFTITKLPYFAAIFIAFFEICGFLDFNKYFQQSKINYIFENKFFKWKYFFYFYYDFEKDSIYHKESNKLMKNENSLNIISVDESDDLNKSRYEEVNVGDYMLKKKDQKNKNKNDESFEI